MTARPVVKSADRVVDVLELLASEPEGLTVRELGNRLAIARSSIHGLVSTLLARGYLKEEHAQNGGARKLRLGSRLIQLGLNVAFGKVTCKPVADALGYKYVAPEALI